MKVIGLKIENVKRLKAVEITPNGASVVVGGKNGQGKSSILDAILFALAIAQNPTLRVMLIRHGSDLDPASLESLLALATKHDIQVWIERVGDGAECSVVIEDGEIREDRTKPNPDYVTPKDGEIVSAHITLE